MKLPVIRAFLRAFLAEARRIRQAADVGTPPRVGWIERARDVDGYLVAELHQPGAETEAVIVAKSRGARPDHGTPQ